MKNIKIIFASLFAAAMLLSCNDDGGDSVRTLQEGAVPNIKKVEGSDLIINLVNVQEGNEFALSFTVDKGFGDPASMDVVGFYIKTDGTVEKAILADNVTTFPTTINLTKASLISTFESLATDADFALGDQLKISTDLTLKDGTVIKLLNEETGAQNYGQDIANSTVFSVTQTYTVSCPSDLGGTYSVLSSGSSTDSGPTPDENPISDFASTTIITDNGGGNYTMSDGFGGLYLLWYDIYGITADNAPGSFSDVCGTISGSFTDAFGGTVNLTGTVNPDGTLTIHFENEFGDLGDSVYTKQ
ncbi:hypothetical protein R1T16_07700 [Flavobacterium sp. DG1-102-2]|uniref:hypothetical protein n=1 Tax=Flavobacterium sp. DG1-102-2 TaxID=3081663 RepID=UPI0029492B24|nr:hypothetical protein [Flavobacterium sp. DG1-102-2]MDV6168306.1 hypothetical protein [Flavobacterium sp. DG1-102-2]